MRLAASFLSLWKASGPSRRCPDAATPRRSRVDPNAGELKELAPVLEQKAADAEVMLKQVAIDQAEADLMRRILKDYQHELEMHRDAFINRSVRARARALSPRLGGREAASARLSNTLPPLLNAQLRRAHFGRPRRPA